MGKSKDPIRLRQRKLKTGNTSLYLDIYMSGRRSYEYLNLYLVEEKTRADKEKNKETLRMADAIRAKRIVDLQNGRFGFERGYKQDTVFLDYFRSLCEERRQNRNSLGNWGTWRSALNHLERYVKDPHATFRDITPEFIIGFKKYLDKATNIKETMINAEANWNAKPLSSATKASYFTKFRACLNKAHKEGIIPRNPMNGIDGFKIEEQERSYLTIDEVRAMAATTCKDPALRRAFLFSCLTGLRKSDIAKMTWSEVRQQGEFTRIVFKQKKTGGLEYIDITPQAVELLGEQGEPDAHIFPKVTFSTYHLSELKRWAQCAGITKKISFHTGRHTFAVIMLDLGVDIYTVQKLLGHRKILTTQIYAKVIDKNKQAAALKIPSILPPKDRSEEK